MSKIDKDPFSQEDFNYGHQLSSSKLKNGNWIIKLPVTMSGQPDFEYMEKYIELLQTSAKKRLCDYQKIVS